MGSRVIGARPFEHFSSSFFFFVSNLSLSCRRSIHSIAKEMGVWKPTVELACNNWVKYGVVTRKQLGSKPRAIPAELLKTIGAEETLQKQKFLSLKQRCAIFFDTFGLKLSAHGLTNIYRRLGIDYHRTRPQTRRILDLGASQSFLRLQAARDVLNLMASDLPIAFMDETSVQVSRVLGNMLSPS